MCIIPIENHHLSKTKVANNSMSVFSLDYSLCLSTFSFLPKKVINIATKIPAKPMPENIRLYSLLISNIFNKLVNNNNEIPRIFRMVNGLLKLNQLSQDGHCFAT